MREHRKETRRDTVRSLGDATEAVPRDTPARGVDVATLAEERRLAEEADRVATARAERMANEAGASLRNLNARIDEQAQEAAEQRIKVGALIHQYDEVSAAMTSSAHAEIDTARRLTAIEKRLTDAEALATTRHEQVMAALKRMGLGRHSGEAG